MIETDVVVVGGGLAGLACARALQKQKIDFHLIEEKDQLGGRVRTDIVDGFLVDRGFQVLNDTYPAVHRLLDFERLNVGAFAPGANVVVNGVRHRIGDPLRNLRDLVPTLRAEVGSLKDKLLILRLVIYCHDPAHRAALANMTTEDFLAGFGFSQQIIERFFRPFFGGVFLEESLHTSAAKFLTVFGYFSRGLATLPAGGMQALPETLAENLETDRVHTSEAAKEIKAGRLLTEGGKYKCRVVVLAGWGASTALLKRDAPAFHKSHTLAFSLPRGSYVSNYLFLNGSGRGAVQSVAFNSAAQPSYAPGGKALAMVVCREECEPESVKEELRDWFGGEVSAWSLLTERRVVRALPVENRPFCTPPVVEKGGLPIVECGDHTETASIQGALSSGIKAAELAGRLL